MFGNAPQSLLLLIEAHLAGTYCNKVRQYIVLHDTSFTNDREVILVRKHQSTAQSKLGTDIGTHEEVKPCTVLFTRLRSRQKLDVQHAKTKMLLAPYGE